MGQQRVADAVESGTGECQVLTFRLGEEIYGIDILSVREIRAWCPVTRCPQTPAHLLGVLNLRGAVVPIVDLRVRLGFSDAGFTPATVIIVITVETSRGPLDCGLVVDSVADVVDLGPQVLRPAPVFAGTARAGCIQGLAALDDRMILLLATDHVVGRDLDDEAAATPDASHGARTPTPTQIAFQG